MGDMIIALQGTPVPTFLTVGGLVFLFLAVAGQFVGQITVPKERQIWAGVIGFLLLFSGVALYAAPVPPSPTPTATPTPPTNTPMSPTDTPTPSLSSTPTLTPTRKPTRMPSPTATQIPPGTILFEEDFEDGKAQQLVPRGNVDWEIVTDEAGNIFYEVDNLSGSGYTAVMFGSTSWKDFAAEYHVKVLGFSGSSAQIILYFRNSYDWGSPTYQQDIFPYYRKVTVAFWSGSSWLQLKSEPYNFVSGNWYSVRVEAQGTQIRVFVDDSLIIDMADSRREAGQLGLAVSPGTHAQFDDIRVVALGK